MNYRILVLGLLACHQSLQAMETKVTRASAEETKSNFAEHKAAVQEELGSFVPRGIASIITSYLEPAPWELASLWLEKQTIKTDTKRRLTDLQQLSPHVLACSFVVDCNEASNIPIYDIRDVTKPIRTLSSHSASVATYSQLIPYKDGFVCAASTNDETRIWDLSKSDAPVQTIFDLSFPALFLKQDLLVGVNYGRPSVDAHLHVQYTFIDCSGGSEKTLASLLVGEKKPESSQKMFLTKISESAFAGVPNAFNVDLCFIDASDPQKPKIASKLGEYLTSKKFEIKAVVQLSSTKIALLANEYRNRFSSRRRGDVPYGEIVIINTSDIYNPRIEAICKDTALDRGTHMVALSENILLVAYNPSTRTEAHLQIWDISDTKNARLLTTLHESLGITTMIPLREENSFACGISRSRAASAIVIYKPNLAIFAAVTNLNKTQRDTLTKVVNKLEKQIKLEKEELAALESMPHDIRAAIKKRFNV